VPQEDPERLLRNVARRIAELRLAKGFTQEQVAEALGIAVQNFRRIERGRQNLTIKTMAAIAAAIGVRVIDFFQPPATPETVKPRSARDPQPHAPKRRSVPKA
jgi:transcriptional regulator with XRE-family HTH domain